MVTATNGCDQVHGEHVHIPASMHCCGMACKKRFSLVPLMVICVFTGSSCWFATNAVIKDIALSLHLDADVDMVLGATTVIIQVGFIVGTFLLAALSLADRFGPKHIFFIACCLASLLNALVVMATSLLQLLALRFFTGVCLAGIYPVAMKIASSWYSGGLGAALGFILAALVFGTGLPQLLNIFGMVLPWQDLLIVISSLVFFAGVLAELFANLGPYHKSARQFDPCAVAESFRHKLFRANAFGYFGHNWEVYTFWAFIPDMITAWASRAGVSWYGSSGAAMDGVNIHLLTFVFIIAGCLSCWVGALLVKRSGCAPIAFWNLFGSCACCITSPLALHFAPFPVFFAFMFFWGFCVVGDSPQFSALSAQHAPNKEILASAMTVVVCGGFVFTVTSLQLMTLALNIFDHGIVFAIVITPGPLLGLIAFWPVLADTWFRRGIEETSVVSLQP